MSKDKREKSSIALVAFREDTKDIKVEYEILSCDNIKGNEDSRRQTINEEILDIDQIIAKREAEIDRLNEDIERLTNHADGLDYTIAVASGILCGLIDSFFVGEWNFKNAKAISNKKANEKVMDFAKKHGFDEKKCKSSDKLGSAIKFLEEKYKLPGDGAYQIDKAGLKINEYTHHLDDFCHHPNIIGLMCCVLVQFTGSTIYVNSVSEVINLPIEVNEYGKFVGTNPITKLFSGLINWFFNVAKTISNAKGHWMSDLVGSHGSAGSGMGLPGPIMSLLKEISALPCFKDTKFGENLRIAFQNGIGTGEKQVDLGIFNNLFEGASSKFDWRTENAIKHELGRQAIPVIINEVLVRGFYFVRRFITEMKNVDSIRDIPWKSVLPFRNRTIVRMETIASGTFCAVDLADAAIRSAIKSGGNAAKFGANFILHVNFVGIGRFAIAIGTDVGMGIKRQKEINERIMAMNEIINLEHAKVYYKQADMWIAVEDLENAMQELYVQAEKTVIQLNKDWDAIQSDIKEVGNEARRINEFDPSFVEKINQML